MVGDLHHKLIALVNSEFVEVDLWAGPGSCCLKETAAVTVHYFSKYRPYSWKTLAFCSELIVPFWNLGHLDAFALCYVAPHK